MIYCIGRNYAKHAQELGNVAPTDRPVVFFKPPAAATPDSTVTRLPRFSNEVHYEGELALKLGPSLQVEFITIANDLTARDIQREAQNSKSPWGLAKGFKQSCGLGPWVKADGLDLGALEIRLLLNGELKQRGFTKDLLFPVPRLLNYLKENFPLEPGDIVLTGTPEGVGMVRPGDEIQAEIVGVTKATWRFE
ncbi:MAG: fumarylacetoacetate hydrolase family protein [Oligoflexia bacterium]|nr:fumarylacetoacetate hydrolase family protein [Oligoflexia bacterium]